MRAPVLAVAGLLLPVSATPALAADASSAGSRRALPACPEQLTSNVSEPGHLNARCVSFDEPDHGENPQP